ncbi:MAG: RluA family pseudouridine synthase [Bacilli bacterium]
MKEILITKEYSNQRADKFVRKYLNAAPLSFIYKVFREKDVKINNHWIKPNYILQNQDVLKIYVTDAQLGDFNKPKDITNLRVDLDIVYEDENILVINKPKGILVIGDETENRLTLTNIVQSYLYKKGEFKNDGINYVPSPVHRLDRNTSGIVIFAKKLPISQQLVQMLKDRTDLDKYYLALVIGEPTPKKGVISAPIYKDEEKGFSKVASLKDGGKDAKTEYEVLYTTQGISLVKLHLLTGRTHQIRIHMSYINCPIVGDAKYGNFDFNKEFAKKYKYKDQFLIAYKVVFGKLSGDLRYLSNKEFKINLPDKEMQILDAFNFKVDLNNI